MMGALSCLVCSCVYTRPRPDIDENASLYERLGGLPAIESVVAGLTQNIAKDERINGFFVGVNLERVEYQLTQQMLAVHTGMNITEAQFNALVEDLVKSLNTHGVRQREQDELLRALGSMKEDIVNR